MSLSRLAVERILGVFAVALASAVFIQAVSEHVQHNFHCDLLSLWNSSRHAPEVFLFLSPGIIFGITTYVYYRFIVNYTGEIAGWSVAGLFAALFCCIKLLEAMPDDWGSHLSWVYALFVTYVVWDVAMLLWFLPRADDRTQASKDEREIRNLTYTINQPTLLAVLVMWYSARHFVADGVDPVAIGRYVEGVVGFHLMFASAACLLNFLIVKLMEIKKPSLAPVPGKAPDEIVPPRSGQVVP